MLRLTSRTPTTGRFAGAVLLAVASLVPYQAANAETCTFAFGFATLHDQIPGIVGDCTENAHYDGATGNGLQATTNGLLVWRKRNNSTAFTNGYETWLDGPFGLETRLSSQRFAWEPNPDHLAIVPPPQAGDQCITAGTTLSVIGTDAGAGNVYAVAPMHSILASSSSGIPMEVIQSACARPRTVRHRPSLQSSAYRPAGRSGWWGEDLGSRDRAHIGLLRVSR